MNSVYASISVNGLLLRGLIISLRSIMLLTSFMLVLLQNGEGAFYIITTYPHLHSLHCNANTLFVNN